MLCSEKESRTTSAAPTKQTLVTCFKPRQLIIKSHTLTSSSMAPKTQETPPSLPHEQRLLVLQSMAHFIQQSGFSKTLKKFLKEAGVEKVSLNGSSPSMEEVWHQYFKIRNDAKEAVEEERADQKGAASVENTETVKENGGKENKKKSKSESEKKEKKQKKEKIKSNKSEEDATNPVCSEADKEKKVSKKRKKERSEEDEAGLVEEADTKRRKTDSSDQSNGEVDPPKTPNGFGNGVQGKDGGNQSQKTKKKELNGSAEPKTINAFRRVKPEEVEFLDDRLQDNSYWAKDGADSGYGAKAQEVLGQVKGRGFRHEKTKKKRGSYRGGQIDLHTHSVKFNNSDDEE